MAFPVDILTNVDHESLELAAEEYMSQLPYRNHEAAEFLSPSDSKQIAIGLCNVSFVPLYGMDSKKKLLALFSPDDFKTVVGLYLLGQWWGVEDVLKTAEPSRTGLIKVSTLGERIVLYVLNRIVLRHEKSSEEVSFLCHCEHESAKILWKDGEAIGFYSYKPKGSLCRNFLTQCYQLPVMDTVFVRKCHRGKSHGVKILEDFVGSFRKELIGLKFPLSEAMYKVCEKYFSIYPADKEILWEVEKIGSPFQRTLIAKSLQKLKLKEVDDIPVTRRGRGSDLKRRGIRENSEERLSKIIIRVEDIEAGVESPIEVATEEHLDDTFSVKESETLRSTTDTVTTTVTNISEVRSSQKEEEWEIEKDKVTATSEGTLVTHFTTAGEIKSQGGSEKECEMVNKEHTVVIQRATIGSIDQSQLQSVVDIEIVRMSTGTEEEKNENLEKNKEVEKDKPVCEAEKEEIKQMLDEPEEEKAVSGTVETYNNTEALEEVTDQSGTLDNKAEESKVEEYNDKDKLTVETDFTMDAEITQVGETVDVVPKISEIDQEEAPQQSSVESAEVHKLKTTPEEDEETVENSSMMLTLTEAKLSPKEASDNHGEIDIAEQDEIKSVSTEEQAAEEIMRMEEQDGTLDTREAYNAAADAKITPEQSTGYEEQEGEPEPETTEVVLLSQVEKPEEKTDTEQAKEDADKLIPKQGKQAQKKGSTDTPSRSTSLRDQPVDPGVTVRCLRSTSKPIKITPVRRSTRSKAVIQQVESVEPQVEAKFRTDENPERDEVNAKEVGTEESEKANTNVDETVVIETGSSEVLKATEIDDKEKTPQITEEKVKEIKTMENKEANLATEIDDKEKTPQITEGTEKDIPLVEAEPDEDVTEKDKEIKTMENKEANLARQRDSCIEMSSLAQEKNVHAVEAPVRTEISLRRRTIRVQSPLRRKSRRVQNQEAEPDVEHQERHAVVTKSKSESISTTEERVEEMDQEVNKMENKEATLAELEPVEENTEKIIPLVEGEPDEDATEKGFEEINKMEKKEINLAELEPVEEPDMIRNEDEKTSTEETVNVCLPIITTETSFESLDDMKTVETAAVDTEKSELLMGVEIDDQEKEAEPDEETGIEDGTPVIKIQKATVVLVDLNKLSQNTEEVESPEVFKHSQMEEHLELDKPDKSEQELCNLASEEEEQKEEIQTQEDTEMIPEEEKIEEEKSTVEELNKLDEQDMAFEEQKPTEDLATMHNAQSNLVESNKNENNQNEDEIVEAETEEEVVEKGNKETNLAVTKDTVEEAPEMGEEANLEQQKNELLIKNVNETAETEKPMEMVPVVNKEQTCVIEETTIQIEEKVSQVESTETNLNDNARITRRSLRLSAKSVTESTQKTTKSTRLHKAELEPVKAADTSKNKYEETSATTERTVNVCIPVITVETSLESPDEIPNTNVEKTSAVEPETSELLMGVETADKNEAPQIVEEVSFVEAEPDEEVEKDDGTPIIQLQKATVVLVDLNNLSQNTEGECDTPQVLTHSQTEEQLELDEPDKSEYQQCIQTSENEEQQEELQKEEDTEKTPEEEENKTEEENTVEEQNKLDKQDLTFEEQKPTEDLEGQNDVKETEIVEEYEAAIDVDVDVEEAVTSKEHPEATTTADKIIQEADIALKEKQMDSDIEISSLTQEAPEAVQEILEEEVPISTERSLRRRTIKVQSPPRRKSRRVQKQEAKVFEDKTREVPITEKGVDEMHKEDAEIDDKEETLQKSTLEATGEIIPLMEEKHDEEIKKKGFKETNKIENKETNLDMTKDTDEKAPEMVEEANLEQQENEPLVKNQKETDETENPMEIDPVVNKEQTYIIEETNIQIEEKTSQVENTETNQSDNERITKRSLRLSAKSVTESTQKTRKSTRLHKAELEPVKAADMSENKYKETSEKTEETVNVCIPIITVEPNLESIGEIANTNLEETTAVEPETSELQMGLETDDKNEAPQIVEEVSFVEAEPDEEVEKDDGTPIIQLQKATVVLVDLNTNLSQNTEGECDTLEVLTHSQTEEQLELDKPDKSEYQQCIQTSENEEQQEELQKDEDTEKTPEEEENKTEEENTVEEQNKLDKQDMTFEEQKPTEDLEGQNDVKEIVEEYKAVVDEDVEEAVTSKEHLEATTMAENDQDIALKEKQMDSSVEISGLTQEAPEAVQEILEEEVSVSTERSLRRRTIKVQSPPRRKSRRVQKQEAEADVEHQERHTVVTKSKTESISMTEKTVEEIDQEVNKMENKEANLDELEPVKEDTEKIIPLVEGELDEDVIEKRFEEINRMENKETSLENDAAPEMGREDASVEQHENEPLVINEKETAEAEKSMEVDKVPVVCKEQTCIIEETAIQVEEKVAHMESSETNENKSERITRRSVRISAQSESTQKTRKSTRLHTAELEPVKEADMSGNEETSTTVETVNVCLPIITVEANVKNLDEDGDMVSMSRKVETTSHEQEIDISNDKGKVDEALPDKSTDDEEDETKSSIKTTENEILVEVDKPPKNVEGGVQGEEKAEPPQENTGQKREENIQENERTSSVEEDVAQQEPALSKEENVGETNPTNELKTTAVDEKVVLESSDQEAPFITRRSLRYRTVTVQSTPIRKSKHLHRQEVESEKVTKDNICGNENDSAIQETADDLNILIEMENKALNAEESIAEFENPKTKEEECITQENIEGMAEETGTKDDAVEEGNEVLFEINESNSASPENTKQNKTLEENFERDAQVPKEQEDEVSSVQEEEKLLQERENEEAVQGSSFGSEETAVERRTLRKRLTVEIAAPRKSKRLRKQEHDEDSEQVKEAVMSSDVPTAVFEGSNLGGEIQQKNAEGTKSDGDCNIHEDTKTDAGNKPQTDEDNKEVMEQNSKKVEETGEMEEVIEQHLETEKQKLESKTNEGFTLVLEVEETSDQEENKADEESRVAMEAPKDIFTSAEKSDEGEENISDEDEKGLAIEKHVLKSSSSTSSSRRRSMRLQMHEPKKNTKEDESDSEESEVQETAKQRHQRKRKAITDLTPARRSKRYVRGKNV
ncbi:Soluble lamin-associated protein of 75 kDa [Anabarilius grahami]|uniref:Soluble lamin-associated protein of 75 kDa n=1 Tax=Anabarilius grahami TaxID=495550 RepID=A0A3N0Y429_ANAGA|nr:Soluble lamin-associated protein of 75 kDa [Anabarilius grahami]